MTEILPSHGREGTEAAGGDPSRSRHERHHFRVPLLQLTVAIRLSLANQPPSASSRCPYAAATTTNVKDRIRWAGFQFVKRSGFRRDTNEASRATRTGCDGAAGEAERPRK